MPLSAAERMRQYRKRIKEDNSKYDQYIEKERQRYKERKEKGNIKAIHELPARAQRAERKKWRDRKRKQRSKQKQVDDLINNTPPHTPPGISSGSAFPIVLRDSSERRQKGRKKVKRDRASAYRKIKVLEEDLKNHKRINERLRKRLYRQGKRQQESLDSPRKKTQEIVRNQKVNETTRRILLFHNVLVAGLRRKFKSLKKEKHKKLFSKIVMCNMLKKYRLQAMAKHELELSQRRMCTDENVSLDNTGSARKKSYVHTMAVKVEEFLKRDDNSRIKAGKKSTKTKMKDKRQIRLLNDTLKNLFLKFKAENAENHMSYGMFCRLRPFYIRTPNASDRQTCLCKRHENLKFKSEKLKQLRIIIDSDVHSVANDLVCNTDNKDCMYRVCQNCSTSHVQFHVTDVDTESMVEYFEWKTIRKEVPCKEKMKTVTMTVKVKEKATIKNLMNDFENDLMKCCSHLYNIRHQYLSIRQLKEKLTSEDMLLHIDFSENYTGKYDQEIQSVHFGGSSKQISLHTGVLYTEGTTIPFCSMSDELLHNPAAIWAHLMPVFEFSKQKFPDIRNLYLLSDGPTTQYRNKENFLLLSTEPYKLGYEKINWNFTEAGHGKGAPDGVGGTIKREADRIVSHGIGNDITSAKQLFNALKQKDCKMELFLVDEEKINYYTQLLKLTKLSPVPGTMKIHQVFNFILS